MLTAPERKGQQIQRGCTLNATQIFVNLTGPMVAVFGSSTRHGTTTYSYIRATTKFHSTAANKVTETDQLKTFLFSLWIAWLE